MKFINDPSVIVAIARLLTRDEDGFGPHTCSLPHIGDRQYGVGSEVVARRGNNRARYSSPEYDALVERYVRTFSTQDRLELAKHINRHISENLPALGLLYRIDLVLHRGSAGEPVG